MSSNTPTLEEEYEVLGDNVEDMPSLPNIPVDVNYDLTSKLAPFMDLHLVLPLLDYLMGLEMYPEEDLMKQKLRLLADTCMADFQIETYLEVNDTEEVPEEMEARKNQILDNIDFLKEKSAPVLELLEEKKEEIEKMQNEKTLNLKVLESEYGITPDMMDTFYKYAKLQFDCGNYLEPYDQLAFYISLVDPVTHANAYLNAMWGKLASEILLFKWEDAVADIKRISDHIESRHDAAPLEQLQQRTWLLHWSLFVFGWYPEGRDQITDFFFHPKSLEAIQTNAPHLLRYVAAGVILHKRRRNLLSTFLKVLRSEPSYTDGDIDPIVAFVQSLAVDFDFDAATKKLKQCEIVMVSDFFLYEENRLAFMQAARVFTFETYCRIHRKVYVDSLAELLGMDDNDNIEQWVVELIREAKLDAKIDTQEGTNRDCIVMGNKGYSVHEQMVYKTKDLAIRTANMAHYFHKNFNTEQNSYRGSQRNNRKTGAQA